MVQKLQVARVRDVAVLRLSNPPRNFLGPILRAEIADQLTEFASDTSVAGVLLTGSEGIFSTGLNAASPDMRLGDPSLADLCDQIEAMEKPVVAALFGVALGAGLELALAAHGRVALDTTRVGLPDIGLGLIPSAGTTQRLPRLLGADRALAVMLSGQVLPVTHPRMAGLVDEIVAKNVETAGINRLQRMIAGDEPICPTRQRQDGMTDPRAYQAAIKACQNALGPDRLIAEHRIVDCVERALLLPFDAGVAFEQTAFEDCAASDQAMGLLHVQLAQRRASNMPEAISAKPEKVSRIGIVGGGETAAALVRGALEGGFSVHWFERNGDAISAARTRLDQQFDAIGLDADARGAALARLTMTMDLRDFNSTEVLIEAVADNPNTKKQLFAALDKVLPDQTILLTHTSTQSIAKIAESSGRAANCLGFYCPPTTARMRLAEVIPAQATLAQTVVTAAETLRRFGVLTVRTGSQGGTLGLRMIGALRDAADYVLGLGVSSGRIDRVLSGYGLNGGVFAAMAVPGMELAVKRAAQLHRPDRFALAHVDRLVRLIGIARPDNATGPGLYDWIDSTVVPLGGSKKALTDTQILHLCLGAMMNEGARLLSEGGALRPSDIDLVMVRHYGFPAWKGGPMHAAGRTGLFTLAQAMRPHADAAPRLFDPHPGVADLIKNGETFDVLNAVGRNRRRIGGQS